MAVYMINSGKNMISEAEKSNIASDIADMHSSLAKTLKKSVHVFFFEDFPSRAYMANSIFIFCNIRAGLSQRQKALLSDQTRRSAHRHTRIAFGKILFDTADLPARWVIEGGQVQSEKV